MTVAVDPTAHAATLDRGRPDVGETLPRFWYALWTNSRCERLVHDQLVARGFDPFLPRVDVWSRRGSERRVVSAPLFPGYLFLRPPAMAKATYIELCQVRGLVRILGERCIIVLCVALLQRSVAVEVDCTTVAPA